MHRIAPTLQPIVLVCVLFVATSAAAGSFSQGLSFSAGSQGIWGPGRSSGSFGASGSAGVPSTFFTPAVGGGFDLSASSGSVSGSLSGSFSAQYADELSEPGLADIQLGFAITGGSVRSSLGARADVTGYIRDVPFYGPWEFCIYCANYSLDTSILLSGQGLGSQRSDSDSFNVAGVGPDLTVLGATAARAQVTMAIDQTARFTPQALIGDLIYTHRATGTTRILPFDLAGLSVLEANLDLPGEWDFSFGELDLENVFDTTIGGSLAFEVEAIGIIDERFPFAGLDILDTPSFSLAFGGQTVAGGFTVTVVPEPATALLLGAGLVGLAAFGRPRTAAPGSPGVG